MTTKRSILNLKEMRAEKAKQQSVVTDQNGKDHVLGGLTIGSYLDILSLEETFNSLQKDESEGSGDERKDQMALIDNMKEFILGILPEFPVDGLYLDELFLVIQAIQSGITPAKEGEDSGDAGN